MNKVTKRSVKILVDNLNEEEIANNFNISYSYIVDFVIKISNSILNKEDIGFLVDDLETIKTQIKKNQLIILTANLVRLKECFKEFALPTWVKDVPKLNKPMCISINSATPNKTLSMYNIYIPDYQIEENFGKEIDTNDF